MLSGSNNPTGAPGESSHITGPWPPAPTITGAREGWAESREKTGFQAPHPIKVLLPAPSLHPHPSTPGTGVIGHSFTRLVVLHLGSTVSIQRAIRLWGGARRGYSASPHTGQVCGPQPSESIKRSLPLTHPVPFEGSWAGWQAEAGLTAPFSTSLCSRQTVF